MKNMLIKIENIHIQHLPTLSVPRHDVAVLRLDLLHPVISGNKWFKLQYYLTDAIMHHAHTLFTFGGAFSNHLVATACAGMQHGLNTVGIVRGDADLASSPTLEEARSYGMELIFVDRETYRDKPTLMARFQQKGWYCIPEGGYGLLGCKGAADILRIRDCASFTHILCACGTGTMVSGLMQASLPHQQVTGISVLKNNISIFQEVKDLLNNEELFNRHRILLGHDRGGYARYDQSLLDCMNDIWEAEKLPTDFVYTAKMLAAAKTLIQEEALDAGNILLIHSGGLQGNRSLKPGSLRF